MIISTCINDKELSGCSHRHNSQVGVDLKESEEPVASKT